MTWGAVGTAAVATVGGVIAANNTPDQTIGGQTEGRYYHGGYFDKDPSVSSRMNDWYVDYTGTTYQSNQEKRKKINELQAAEQSLANRKSRVETATTDAERKRWQKLYDQQLKITEGKRAQLATYPTENKYETKARDYNQGIADQYGQLQNSLKNQQYGQQYRDTLTNLIDNPGDSTGIGIPDGGYQGLLDKLSNPSTIGFGNDSNAFSFLAPGNAKALESTYNAQSGILGQLAGLAGLRAKSGYSDIYDPALIGIKTAMNYSPENSYFDNLNYGLSLWNPVETSRLTTPFQPMMSSPTNNATVIPGQTAGQVIGNGISNNAGSIVQALGELFN